MGFFNVISAARAKLGLRRIELVTIKSCCIGPRAGRQHVRSFSVLITAQNDTTMVFISSDVFVLVSPGSWHILIALCGRPVTGCTEAESRRFLHSWRLGISVIGVGRGERLRVSRNARSATSIAKLSC